MEYGKGLYEHCSLPRSEDYGTENNSRWVNKDVSLVRSVFEWNYRLRIKIGHWRIGRNLDFAVGSKELRNG